MSVYPASSFLWNQHCLEGEQVDGYTSEASFSTSHSLRTEATQPPGLWLCKRRKQVGFMEDLVADTLCLGAGDV